MVIKSGEQSDTHKAHSGALLADIHPHGIGEFVLPIVLGRRKSAGRRCRTSAINGTTRAGSSRERRRIGGRSYTPASRASSERTLGFRNGADVWRK